MQRTHSSAASSTVMLDWSGSSGSLNPTIVVAFTFLTLDCNSSMLTLEAADRKVSKSVRQGAVFLYTLIPLHGYELYTAGARSGVGGPVVDPCHFGTWLCEWEDRVGVLNRPTEPTFQWCHGQGGA